MVTDAVPEHRASFRRWAVGVASWILLSLAVLLSGLPETSRAMFSAAAISATAVLAATSCLVTARRSSGRRRRAWVLLGSAGYIGFAGNAASLITGTTQTGDLAYLAALLVGIVALLHFPSRPLRATHVARMVLDGVVVGGSVLFIATVQISPDRYLLDASAYSDVLALVYPVVDAVLASLAVVLITRSSRWDRVPLVLVGLSFVLYALADLSYAVLGISAFSLGTPIDLGWITGYALGGLAARHPAASGGPRERQPEKSSPIAATVLTFAMFIVAMTIGMTTLSGRPWNVVSLAFWLVILVGITARQTIVVIDNERLRRDLQRRVEKRTTELRAVTRSTEAMLSSVGDGIYGVDRDGRITFVNPAAERTLGHTAADLIGQHAHTTFHTVTGVAVPRPADRCYIDEAIHDGITATAEEDVYRRADGKHVPVEVTASPLRDGPRVLGAVVAFRDTTQRREVDRLKNEFVSVISHELRTPLTSIRGSLGLLLGRAVGTLPPQATRMITIALESSERLSRLIDDILEVERIGAGAEPMRLEDHEAGALIASAVDQVRGAALTEGVSLKIGETSGVVHADADRIVQTLINLLGNAIKFSPSGSEVAVCARPAGRFVEFRVTDRGRGIPQDRLEAIFGRFEQVDSSDAREKGGTGLGLAICRTIVERHGGRIWATSAPGAGATFHFTLPGAERRPAPEPHEAVQPMR